MNILVIGDIVGKPGRTAIASFLPSIMDRCNVDFVVANGENAAGGFGLTPAIADELFDYGIDVITSGNHIWDKKEIYQYLDDTDKIVRPANYPQDVPGKGYVVAHLAKGVKVAVMSLSGRVFLAHVDCPFRTADDLLQELAPMTPIILIDVHAEATAEKVALGWYLDGRVSAVLGTHTHVQTADERVLPKGTAYITDIGMCGPRDSVIGIESDIIVNKFLTQMPARFKVARGTVMFNAVLLEVDESTGKARSVVRINCSSSGYSHNPF